MSDQNEDLLSAEANPTGLDVKGKAKSVKRLNKLPILIAIGLLTVFALGLVYVVNKRAQAQQQAAVATEENVAVVDSAQAVGDMLNDAPDGVIPSELDGPQNLPTPKAAARTAGSNPAAASALNGAPAEPKAQPAPQSQQLTEYQRDQLRIQRMQQEQYISALTGDSAVQGFGGSNQNTASAQPASYTPPVAGSGSGTGFDPTALAAAAAAAEDQNKQARKEDFLNSSNSDVYLAQARQKALTPFEVKAGTVIPAVMINGINSDLPGQLSAQVSQNVYNTESGEHLVIPQGTKIVGRYDSQVAYGQERVLIVWDRLVFPDASSIQLAGMPGADQAGYAGFHDQVDNHYFKIFGSAILMSFISAGTQLSQPDNSNSDSEDASTTLSAALGQQLGQVSTEMTRKNLKIQPTLEIRPGYRFNIMVNKDIAFQQPYN